MISLFKLTCDLIGDNGCCNVSGFSKADLERLTEAGYILYRHPHPTYPEGILMATDSQAVADYNAAK
jgi:hypothetical protein